MFRVIQRWGKQQGSLRKRAKGRAAARGGRTLLGVEVLEGRTLPASGLSVALVEAEVSPTDPLVLDVKAKLQATGLFSSITVIDAFATTPTLAQLQAFPSV